jgi:hypothetical protein
MGVRRVVYWTKGRAGRPKALLAADIINVQTYHTPVRRIGPVRTIWHTAEVNSPIITSHPIPSTLPLSDRGQYADDSNRGGGPYVRRPTTKLIIISYEDDPSAGRLACHPIVLILSPRPIFSHTNCVPRAIKRRSCRT